MNTNRWMQEVNARFPVRKSKVQKAQFRQYVLQKAQEMGYAARMEENKAICTNRNIVVGDMDKAKVLVTAHYDKPATVGLPNVMLPMNRPMFYLVQALIALVMVVFIFIPTGIVKKLTGSIFCTEATLIGLYCLMMYLLLAGAFACVGQLGITKAYVCAPAKEISVYDYTQVLFAAALGFFVFGEAPDWLSVLGYVLICGAGVGMFLYNRRHDAAHP